MADISKCEGTGCPLKESCYRYTAPSNTFWQAYIVPPFKTNNGVFSCEMFWGQDQETTLNKAIKKILGR